VYATEELDSSICPWCIASGDAHSKFDAELVEAAGVGGNGSTHLIIADALEEGDFDRAVRRLPDVDDDQLAGQCRHAHHLPESYTVIGEHTPKTVWSTSGSAFELAAVMELLAPFGDGAVIVKDYVKSQKHRWADASFIPSARDPEAVRRVVTKFVELRTTA
jgi:uncharacterized protein CbrC (UPF0167 family)